ncbi:MAG: DUF956 family protein [Atopobiaceae bacterium]|nr:DUF956 family protein [Atopobiaceae bacterium]MBR3315439.1 DUF956 family protein [Atopobiaceae bacterium]
MAQSQNSSVDLTIKATSFSGIASYGDVMVGNKAFEYYNERNVEDYIQIPWEEIDYISAEVVGKKITRFAIFIKQGGHFAFSTRDNKKTLRAVREYVPEDRLLRSKSFLDVVKAGTVAVGRNVVGVFKKKDNGS